MNHCEAPFSEKLTQLVEISFHPGHFLKHYLAPDGVVTVGPTESLQVLVDRALDGAQAGRSGVHSKDHEWFFNPARSHPGLPGYHMSTESRMRGGFSSTFDVMCCWCFLSPHPLSSGVYTDHAALFTPALFLLWFFFFKPWVLHLCPKVQMISYSCSAGVPGTRLKERWKLFKLNYISAEWWYI